MKHSNILKTVKEFKLKKCSCEMDCYQSFKLKNIRYLRYRYWTKSRQMRSQWLIQIMKNSERKGRYQYMNTDSGERVCSKAFLKLYNINKNLLVKCNKLAARNALASDTSKFKDLSVETLKCMSWFEDYVTACADRMPDHGTILLPYKTTKTAVYSLYKEEHFPPVSRMTFENIWRHHFPHVKVKQVRSVTVIS